MRRGVRGQTVTLRGLWRDPRSGKPFYRTRAGGKAVLVRLPDLPNDHPDLIAAWAAAARAEPAPEPARPGSIASLWAALLGSRDAADWSPSYLAMIRRHATAICTTHGTLPATGIRDTHVGIDVAGAAQPVARLKAWRAWGKWGKARGYLRIDPAATATRPKTAPTDGHPAWFEVDVARFRARWPVGTVERAAMELMHYTGCRVSDAVLIGPQHVDRGGVLAYRQRKTGQMAYCPWSCALPAHAAHLAADRDLMKAALAPFAGHLTFLATVQGRTRSEKALAATMGKACVAAGVAASSHGLRKWRAIDLVEHGATSPDCGAWTGHHTLREIERYIAKRDRRRAVMGTEVETDTAQRETGR